MKSVDENRPSFFSLFFLSFLSFFSFFFCLSRTRFSFSFSPTRLVEYLARPVVLPPRVNLPIRTRNIINCLARIYDYLSRTPTVNNFKTNLKSSVFFFSFSFFTSRSTLSICPFPRKKCCVLKNLEFFFDKREKFLDFPTGIIIYLTRTRWFSLSLSLSLYTNQCLPTFFELYAIGYL